MADKPRLVSIAGIELAKQKDTAILERTGTGALLTVPKDGAMTVESETQSLSLRAGDWIIVQYDTWAALIGQVAQSRQAEIEARRVLNSSTKAGRIARRNQRRMD